MDVSSKLTIYFEEPFWVGVYEYSEGNVLEVSKIVFGAEPKDYMIYDFLLKNLSELPFSPPLTVEMPKIKKANPKRLQRQINDTTCEQGIGTKAQQALKLQYEQRKSERLSFNREKSEEEKKRRFELHQQKKKEKHKGR